MWKGIYYQYNCLPFELSTTPRVFSKVILELEMYWKSKGINIIPYLEDFLILIMGYDVGCLLAKIVKEAMRRAGLAINWDKSDDTPKHERRHLGFDVDLADGLFKIPIAKWEALREDTSSVLNSKGSRGQARKLVCHKLASNIYQISNNVPSVNCWVTIDDEAHNELLFGKTFLA